MTNTSQFTSEICGHCNRWIEQVGHDCSRTEDTRLTLAGRVKLGDLLRIPAGWDHVTGVTHPGGGLVVISLRHTGELRKDFREGVEVAL